MNQEALEALLQDLSLEEKVYQLIQYQGANYSEDAVLTGLLDRNHITPRELGMAGSTLCIWGADKLRKIQDACMAVQPHHIPMLFMLDVIHGHRTVFPCPLGLGASFSPALVEQSAAVAARESAAEGVHVTFAPMADLVRDARWGRCMESTGEDACLNGQMAAAMVRGFQGDDLRSPEHIAACVKHFAGYGAPVAGKDYQNIELSEYTLREFYLPAYKAAIDAGAKMVMTGFHACNGIPCTGNTWLMQQVLRQEMGFDGVLISDYCAVNEMVTHGFCEDLAEAAGTAMDAGVDIDMEGRSYAAALMKLVQSGAVPVARLDEAVRRVLRLKNELGLFEDPYHGASEARAGEVVLRADHRALARKIVAESLVLLKNQDGLLPLRKGKIAFVGPCGEDADLRSAWSFSGDPADSVSVRQAAEELGWETRFAKGCTLLDNDTRHALGLFHTDAWKEENDTLLREAEEAAAWADTVVVCLGEHRLQTGEAASRVHLRLPEIQLELLRRVAAQNRNVVVLLFNGRPLVLDEVEQYAGAILECWLPGTEGGHGILDVLTGAVSPSGKIPMSFPYAEGQEPMSYDHFSSGRPAVPGTETYVCRYLDCPDEPRYPFGYGLSYTTFALTGAALSDREMYPGKTLTVTASLENTGRRAGSEVVQLYLRDVTGSRIRPVKSLKGFRKIFLQPGERRQVSFTITEEMLRFYTRRDRWESEPGRFRVYLGTDSRVEEYLEFTLLQN